MFLPNSHSFLLARARGPTTKKPKTNSSSPSSDSDRSILLSNAQSFLLSGKKKPTTQKVLKSSPPPPSDSDRNTFLPNSHSFLLSSSKKSTTQKAVTTSLLSYPDFGDSSNVFLPNSQSFLLSGNKKQTTQQSTKSLSDPSKSTVSDIHKRAFLKVAAGAGASIAGSLLLPNKAEALIMGSSPTTGVVGVKNAANARINPATEETVDSILKTSDLAFTTGSLDVNVTDMPASSSSFSDSGDTPRSGLVDVDRHVQVDVLSSALPTSASTETTLQTISFGGQQLALRLDTVDDIDYVGEAAIGSATSATAWRIKRITNTSGDVTIEWADGDSGFNNVWDNRASLSYS